MDRVSYEVLDFILGHCDLASLLNFRLTCRSIEQATTPVLFSTVQARPGDGWLRGFMNILQSSHLVIHVRQVTFLNFNFYHPRDDLYQLHREAVFAIVRCPNLENVRVAYDDGNLVGPCFGSFGRHLLDDLFEALSGPRHLIPKLKLLSLERVDWLDGQLTNRINYHRLASRLKCLRMETTIGQLGRQTTEQIFTQIHRDFLGPCRDNLTHLTLQGNSPWLNVSRALFSEATCFPNLKVLELSNFAITHEWQLDWIVCHRATLEDLQFCDVFICHQHTISDVDGYLFQLSERNESIYENPLRWTTIFQLLEERTPKLKRFKLGCRGRRDKFRDEIAFSEAVFLDRYQPLVRRSRCELFPHWLRYTEKQRLSGRKAAEISDHCAWPQDEPGLNRREEEAYGHLMKVLERRRINRDWTSSR